MAAWWQSLSALDHVLLYIAIPATLILLIQTVLLFAGGAFDSDGDAGVPDADGPDFDGPDADGGPLHEAAADPETPDTGLHLFTVRGVVAFLVLFGWGGLWLHQVGLPGFLAVFLAIPIALPAWWASPWPSARPFASSTTAPWISATPSGGRAPCTSPFPPAAPPPARSPSPCRSS